MMFYFDISEEEYKSCSICVHARKLEKNESVWRVQCTSEKCESVLRRFPYVSELFNEKAKDQTGALLNWVKP